MKNPITRAQFDAVLLDLDGVITDTASIHAAAWKQMFDTYLQWRAAESGQLDLGHKHGTQQAAIVLPDLSFGQVGDKNLALVHDRAKVHGALPLSDDVAQGDSGQKLADLVQDRRDGFRPHPG